MSKFSNTSKDRFLANFPTASLDSDSCDISNRIKFNFSFLEEAQTGASSLNSMNNKEIEKLMNKLKEYSRSSRKVWESMPIGSGKKRYKVLSVYGSFPSKSNFTFPKSVPHQVDWARFRLEFDYRLIGFFIPDDYQEKLHPITNVKYDCNTFYIVFIDPKHNFYK